MCLAAFKSTKLILDQYDIASDWFDGTISWKSSNDTLETLFVYNSALSIGQDSSNTLLTFQMCALSECRLKKS